MAPATRAGQFEARTPERAELWANFLTWPGRTFFPNVVGLQLEEIRHDYARIRLPYRDELQQPAGVVHGGAIATLIDTVVVPAVASPFDEVPRMLTLNMNVQYLGPEPARTPWPRGGGPGGAARRCSVGPRCRPSRATWPPPATSSTPCDRTARRRDGRGGGVQRRHQRR